MSYDKSRGFRKERGLVSRSGTMRQVGEMTSIRCYFATCCSVKVSKRTPSLISNAKTSSKALSFLKPATGLLSCPQIRAELSRS